MSAAGANYPNGTNFPPPPPHPPPPPAGQDHYYADTDGRPAPGVGSPPPPPFHSSPPPRDSRASFDSTTYSRAGADRRPYPRSEPYANDGNLLTPYDNEKAYAEYTDAYGPPPSQSSYGTASARAAAPPPQHPPTDYDRGYPDDLRRADPRDRYYPESEDSYYDSRYYDDRRRDSRPPPPSFDERPRRYDSRDSYDEPPAPRTRKPGKTDKDFFRQGKGERGLASAVLGAAAGAWIGHEAGRGALGTLSGMAVGAIGGSAIEKHADKYLEKKRSGNEEQQQQQHQQRRRRDSDYESRYPSQVSSTRAVSPSRRRRDSRATSWDSGPRRRYDGSPDSYMDDRR